MKTLLQQLYSGEIYPAEEIVVKTSESRALSRNISDEKTYFKSLLSTKDRERFDDLGDMELQRAPAYAFENFVYGFRLGVGLMLESLETPSNTYRRITDAKKGAATKQKFCSSSLTRLGNALFKDVGKRERIHSPSGDSWFCNSLLIWFKDGRCQIRWINPHFVPSFLIQPDF